MTIRRWTAVPVVGPPVAQALWRATGSLTSGLVAHVYGLRDMGPLCGIGIGEL